MVSIEVLAFPAEWARISYGMLRKQLFGGNNSAPSNQ